MDLLQESVGHGVIYKSNVTIIFFLGFSNNITFNILFFLPLLLIIYVVTVCGNLLIIMLVSYSKTLHSPMYFFLTQLSTSDIMLITDIVPNMLNILLNERPSISFLGCITQFYFFGLTSVFECSILTVMSYDRYLAICYPLHYISIMGQELCMKLIFASWLLSCSISIFFVLSICQLQFCGPNTIDNIFCDFNPILKLSCSDVSVIRMEASVISIFDVIFPFVVTLISYIYIVITISKIPSFSGRLKSFSTCSSHLTVVCMYYGTLTVMYVLPNENQSQIVSRMLAILYTVLTPFLNPFIYSLKNKDIKEAFKNILHIQRAYH